MFAFQLLLFAKPSACTYMYLPVLSFLRSCLTLTSDNSHKYIRIYGVITINYCVILFNFPSGKVYIPLVIERFEERKKVQERCRPGHVSNLFEIVRPRPLVRLS